MEHNTIIEFLVSEAIPLFSLQLIATMFGALFGFGLVVRWDRNKKKTERRETRNMIIDSLVEEMKENLEGLNQYQMPSWNIQNGNFRGTFGLVSISAFQSTVNGGHFVMLPIELQTKLNVINQHAELFNKFMNEIIGFSSGGLPGNQLSVVTNELIRRLQEQKSQLQTKLPENITELKTLRKKEK